MKILFIFLVRKKYIPLIYITSIITLIALLNLSDYFYNIEINKSSLTSDFATLSILLSPLLIPYFAPKGKLELSAIGKGAIEFKPLYGKSYRHDLSNNFDHKVYLNFLWLASESQNRSAGPIFLSQDVKEIIKKSIDTMEDKSQYSKVLSLL